MFLRILLLCLLGCCAFGRLGAAEFSLVIVASERTAPYQEAADALLGELERHGVSRKSVLQIAPVELATTRDLAPKLFITLGVEAAMAVARSDPRSPVLCALLPQESFERIKRESSRRPAATLSAVYIDQPLTRQFDLVRLALPGAGRLGLILGEVSRGQLQAAESAAQGRGFKLLASVVVPGEPIFKELKKILEEVDLLVALPDQQIYNSNSIQNILLTSFRARVPLLAFSPAYVRAGALLAVYSTPSQIGIQTAVMARSVLQGRPLPLPQYPAEFSVVVNENVARSLGVAVDATVLGDRLRALER